MRKTKGWLKSPSETTCRTMSEHATLKEQQRTRIRNVIYEAHVGYKIALHIK